MGKILTDKNNRWSVPTVHGRCDTTVQDLVQMLGSLPPKPKEKRDWSTLAAFLYMYGIFVIVFVSSMIIDVVMKGGLP
jgi:hypothetical protein